MTYLQPIANFNDKDIDKVDIDQIIIEASMVYSSLERLEGIYKKIIPLYSLIMNKHNSSIELLATDKERKSEFKMKTLQYPLLPIFHLNSYISYSPMKFPKVNSGYKTSFLRNK